MDGVVEAEVAVDEFGPKLHKPGTGLYIHVVYSTYRVSQNWGQNENLPFEIDDDVIGLPKALSAGVVIVDEAVAAVVIVDEPAVAVVIGVEEDVGKGAKFIDGVIGFPKALSAGVVIVDEAAAVVVIGVEEDVGKGAKIVDGVIEKPESSPAPKMAFEASEDEERNPEKGSILTFFPEERIETGFDSTRERASIFKRQTQTRLILIRIDEQKFSSSILIDSIFLND